MNQGARFLCAAVIICFAASAAAQTKSDGKPISYTFGDTYKVDYFDNVGAANDGKLRLENGGTSRADLCAAIFVNDSVQELSECCTCLVSVNGLRKLSVKNDLTANPLTGVQVTSGSIQIISSAVLSSGGCPVFPSIIYPEAGIRAWSTHVQDSGQVTEAPSQDAILSTSAFQYLENTCGVIQKIGAGHGLCTCGSGD